MATSITYLESMLLNPNIQAALKTIRFCEGTSAPDGSSYIFGSSPKNKLRFTDFSKHPNDRQSHNGISSTASGAYQILKKTDDMLNATYGFTDFTPYTQDLKCCAILDRIGVLKSVANGLMLQETVMTKLSGQWASLPLSLYGQPIKSMADVRTVYTANGGGIGVVA